MEKLTYPLLYYRLRKDAVLGLLIGTNYQLIEKDLRTLKSALTSHLQQQYKKHNDYWPANIKEPKLKILEVSVRPTYRTNNRSYPLSDSVKIKVPCVYGETTQGNYECNLPLFERYFVYYEAKQLTSLATYIATNHLNRETPESLHRYMTLVSPNLDSIQLKVNYNRSFNYNWGANFKRSLKVLPSLAEQYPYSKARQRNLNSFPDVAWELEEYVDTIIQKITHQMANILVVGNNSVGKSAVLKQVFKKLAAQVRKNQLNYTFWNIMAQRITASTKYLGEWQEKVETMIQELRETNGILWVQDVIQLIQTGGQGAEDSVAAFMIPFLQQGQLQIVGEITPKQLDSLRRLLPGFTDLFQIITIQELAEDKIHSILNKFATYSQENLKIKIDRDALQLAYRLLLRYYPYESFPGKAVKFLGTCVSIAQVNEEDHITKDKVVENFIIQTGLPSLFLKDDLFLDQQELAQHFSNNIIGQANAVEALVDVVKIFKAGLNNPHKPIQTLLFTGPTGVGKTASAKALADYFFGKGQTKSPLIRIDMSEYQHPGMIYRFIGSNREVGKLVQAVREKPFSVLLLDEAEKADASIFDALLSVLDEGMFTDAYGRVTNFRNTIIILTTNLGASNQQSIGFGSTESDESKYLSAIEKFFRPEFINRIDNVIFFHPLEQDAISKISKKELAALNHLEGFVKRGIQLECDDSIVSFLATVGFDKRYGARPLQRAIKTHVIAPMANWLLTHPTVKNQVLKLSYENGLQVVLGKKL